MANYSNFDGTTKPSFRIGMRGIIIEPHALENEEGLSTIAIKKYNDTGDGYVLEVPKAYCCGIKTQGTVTTFSFRDPSGKITDYSVDTRVGGVKGPSFAVENNLAAFADSTGQELKDSGFAVLDSGIDDTADNLESKIPTAAAVADYVGVVSKPLADRIRGS